MSKKTVAKFSVLVLLLFFIFICFITLLDELLSGYLLNPSEWKAFVFVSIDFTVSIIALVGVWKLKKWSYIPLIILTAFGLMLAIIYPPTNISGSIFDKMANLPLNLFVGALALALFAITLQMQPIIEKNGASQNKKG
jgi:hypothetical protein